MPKNEYSVIFAPAADKDLAEITELYVSFGSLNGARRLSAKIAKIADELCALPYIGAQYYDPDYGKTLFRKISVEKYLIFYKVLEEEKKVVIYRVLNGKNNYIQHMRRLYEGDEP